MADLPSYQSTGRVYSELPQLDFANVREAFKQSQTMSNQLDRLSSYAFTEMGKATEAKAEKFALDNPITKEDLINAQSSGIDLIKASGGGQIWEDTLRKFQGEQLRSQLEVHGQAALTDILAQVERRELTDPSEIKQKFESAVTGFEKPLANISPESAVRFKQSMGATAGAFYKEATKKLTADYLIDQEILAEENLVYSTKAAEAMIATITEPALQNEAKNLLIRRVYEQAREAGPTFAKKQVNAFTTRFEELVSNKFETEALSKSFASNPVTGLPDISLTMQKLANNELGEFSGLWANYEQDKKDKVMQSVYTRLTQQYSAVDINNKAVKAAKEKSNVAILIDLNTPGRVPNNKDRIKLATQLVVDQTITTEQYKSIVTPTIPALTARQKYLKDEAAFKIRSGRITTLEGVMNEYGNKLPIDAIGDLLGPLSSVDDAASNKFISQSSGAEHDPYHLLPTTKKQFLEITEMTEKALQETNKDGTPVYDTKLKAAKAAVTKIQASEEMTLNQEAQKRKYEALNTFGYNPDNGGFELWAQKKYGPNYLQNKTYQLLKEDNKKYLDYKIKTKKKYVELP
jgi:hypothetical protein